jgi:ribosome-binding factor A
LAKTVKLRQTPKLRFFADKGMRDGCDIIKKIEGLTHPEEAAADSSDGNGDN